MRGRPIAGAFLLTALALSAACSAPVREYTCVVTPEAPTPDPQALWACHRDIADRAAGRKDFSLREYREAEAFFERLTGVTVASGQTKLGPVPPKKKEMKRTIAEWDAWYEANGDRLVWDAEAGRVDVR